MYPFQGFIPAAGLGTRLRPLTLKVPKPLIPIGHVTPLSLAFQRLVGAGCNSIAINSHHLPDQIRLACAKLGNSHGVGATVSFEPTLLGTGGYFAPLRSWLKRQDVLVHSSDILSDIDLTKLIVEHQNSKAFATMVLLKSAAENKTKIFLEENGDIAGIVNLQKKDAGKTSTGSSFTAVHVLSPEFVEALPKEGVVDIVAIYQKAIESGEKIASFIHDGLWYDIGDPKSLMAVYQDLFFDGDESVVRRRKLGFSESCGEGLFTGKNEEIKRDGYRVGPSCWISNVNMLKQECVISQSIILPGSVIKPGEVITGEIMGYGERVRFG